MHGIWASGASYRSVLFAMAGVLCILKFWCSIHAHTCSIRIWFRETWILQLWILKFRRKTSKSTLSCSYCSSSSSYLCSTILLLRRFTCSHLLMLDLLDLPQLYMHVPSNILFPERGEDTDLQESPWGSPWSSLGDIWLPFGVFGTLQGLQLPWGVKCWDSKFI